MNNIKEVIVVEGKSDVQVLSNIINADFIITNGSAISKETLELIKQTNKTRGVIVFTDPDYPGEKIRKTITDYICTCKHAFVKPKDAKKKNKLGVAEATKEAILEALENIVTFNVCSNKKIENADLFELGLIGQPSSLEKRLFLEEKLAIGHGSAKTFLKRLNMIGFSLDEIKKLLTEEFKYENKY